ncbi:hypothetical protein HYC85_003266 [Camellia sinensis]|uniref:Uncharacterized protein n=1 Tax=Camellia sinensis TaxID=4442 RepID=A0A7J7IBV4_CAMSI|nr:hypothetical protein HYC85_003266 [Camellia sinensis]
MFFFSAILCFFSLVISALALLICPGRVVVQNEVGECFLRRAWSTFSGAAVNGWPTVMWCFVGLLSNGRVLVCIWFGCSYAGQIDTQSIGALAGLAIAILFTWRLLRSTSAAQRRQSKRQATTPSSSGVVSTHSNANLTFSGDLSSEDSRAQNVIDDLQPTLGQIVRQKLSEGRKVTCRLLGVVLEETSPEELQVKQATVRSSVLEVLREITKFCDLYLMERVLDVESEVSVNLSAYFFLFFYL